MSNNTIDWRQNIIREGVTQDGYIAEVEGIHGEESFTYRPMLGQHAEKYATDVRRLLDTDPERGYLEVAKVVAKYLKSWSEPVEVSVDVLSKVRKTVLMKMYYIIRGDAASDPRPNKPASVSDDDAEGTLGKS